MRGVVGVMCKDLEFITIRSTYLKQLRIDLNSFYTTTRFTLEGLTNDLANNSIGNIPIEGFPIKYNIEDVIKEINNIKKDVLNTSIILDTLTSMLSSYSLVKPKNKFSVIVRKGY